MSSSPERISSYRRHFEDTSTSAYQVRVTSLSPTHREPRHRSASYTRKTATGTSAAAVGRRTVSSATQLHPVRMGAICVGVGTEGPFDLDAAAAENQQFLHTRTGERQEMVILNDRLALYIEKVRSLEQQNRLLETEIEALQKRFVKPSGLRRLYEEQLRDMRKVADQMRVQRETAVARKVATAGHLEALKVKCEEAAELRRKAELEIEAFRPDVDAATSARIALEKQLENLEVELEFLQRVHREEIEELMKQIYGATAIAEVAFSLPDLAAALKQVQHQYDDMAAKNLQEMDTWYKAKFENLNQASTKHVDRVRNVRQEIVGAKKEIQSKERDLEALRTKREALEAQIREAQEKHKKELEELQGSIERLQLELKSTKEKIALHLREYQDLLNIKMALEIEITTYRKLIESEDCRLTSMVQSMSLMSGAISVMSGGISGVVSGVGAQLGAIESYSQDQAVETTERKTVIIRTVKTDDKLLQSDTQEQTITITGAADDSEED